LPDRSVEKGFGAVTVRDITERAMVNRSTFYRHYLDKYELLEQYIKEVGALASMEDLPDDKSPHMDGEAPSNLVKMLKHIQKYADFYRIMLGQKGDPTFTERFRQNTASNFRFLLSGVEADVQFVNVAREAGRFHRPASRATFVFSQRPR
jgi:AcrR family transcriptional regulator